MRYELWSVERQAILPEKSPWRKAIDRLLGRLERPEWRIVRVRMWGRYREESEALDALQALDPLDRDGTEREYETVAVSGGVLIPLDYCLRQNGYSAAPSLGIASSVA